MKRMVLASLSIVAAIASGCSSSTCSAPSANATGPATAANASAAPKSRVTALEGSWAGNELTVDHTGAATLKVNGNTLEFHGTDPNDWLKGTFTLHEDAKPKQFAGVITDCASPDYIGKQIYAIYRIEDGALIIAGNTPGETNFPTTFSPEGGREFVFKHDQ